MPARLSVYYPREPVKEFRLDDGITYHVGRGSDCDIQLHSFSVSRRHASLVLANGVWTLTDLGSKNGTKAQGEAIQTTQLNGDRWLSFGDMQARFQLLGQQQLDQQAMQASQRWQRCTYLKEQLNSENDLERLLSRILEGVLQLAGTDRAFILLKDGADRLNVSAIRGVTTAALQRVDFAGSRSAVAEVLKTGRPLVTCDSLDHQFLANQPSIQLNAIRALACLPLALDSNSLLGVVYTDSLLLGKEITELDLKILEAITDNATVAIAATMISADIDELNQGSTDMFPHLSAW